MESDKTNIFQLIWVNLNRAVTDSDIIKMFKPHSPVYWHIFCFASKLKVVSLSADLPWIPLDERILGSRSVSF